MNSQEGIVNLVPEITVQNLDHLGLVAGLIDEIGIVEKINQLLGEQPGEIVSPGHAVKAMIINGLGLVSAPLYQGYFILNRTLSVLRVNPALRCA